MMPERDRRGVIAPEVTQVSEGNQIDVRSYNNLILFERLIIHSEQHLRVQQ